MTLQANSTPAPAAARCKRQPVPVAQTTIEDDFWSPKLRLVRQVTLDDVFTKFEKGEAFANFDKVARGERGGFHGHPWFDGLICETMRGAADFLAVEYDAQLDERLDGYIERIAAAQAADPDGYINTYVTLTHPDKRWGANGGSQLYHHEMYNAGCLVEAGVHHYLALGKTNLLALAVRFANYMCDTIGPAPKHNLVPAHSLSEEALIKLYRLFRQQPDLAAQLLPGRDPAQYLELARFWIDNRGNHQGRISFTEYAQDHCCTVDQPEAVGHAVRAVLLYIGLTALGLELDDDGYLAAAHRLWQDVTERKLYITGGVGPIHEYEGFSYGYYLPNTGYLETCAGVGLAFWAGLMGQAFDGAVYADVYERALYNNILPGVSLDGKRYTYQNPLTAKGNIHRWEWHGCPCCPPMLLKALSELGGQIYAYDDEDIYVHQYVGGRSVIPLPAGEVELTQRSSYVWEGRVAITVHTPGARTFGLRLRLPGWSGDFRLRVNGQPPSPVEIEHGYAVIRREWQDGDTIELELAMPVERVAAHPFVNDVRGKVALQRGPLVYCLEGVDNPDEPNPVLPADAQFEAQYDPDLLGGVAVIRGAAQDGRQVVAVPYYAWDNRPAAAESEDWMQVWLGQAGLEKATLTEAGDLTGWENVLYRPLPL